MNSPLPHLSLVDYRYHLPESRIPDRPLEARENSKLLLYRKGEIKGKQFSELPNLLPSDALLVFNNSKVIPARLHFSTPTGAQVEILCLHPTSSETSEDGSRSQVWKCIVGNLKRWKEGIVLEGRYDDIPLKVELLERGGSENEIRFFWPSSYSFFDVLEKAGEIPLPPYMHRKADDSDRARYQTVYATSPGSVAAPTAGLHFTPPILEELKQKGHASCQVTLHVGAGTFKPIKTDDIRQHDMHQEFFEVDRATLLSLMENECVIAVGTTSLRTLESLYHLGCRVKQGHVDLQVGQWEGFRKKKETKREALTALLSFMEAQNKEKLVASTSIMIVPGYSFKITKGLVTNFHQPESTLVLLVAAFVGEDWKRIYDYALQNQFRFLSYGDSSLLLP